jgi:hypothetical protein
LRWTLDYWDLLRKSAYSVALGKDKDHTPSKPQLPDRR